MAVVIINLCLSFAQYGTRPQRNIGCRVAMIEAITGTLPMTSPYLDRRFLPLAIVLPRMLEKIEADLATAHPAEKPRLRQRAELIRGLLKPTSTGPGLNLAATRAGLADTPWPCADL